MTGAVMTGAVLRYIDVNWHRVQGDFVSILDFDGDGEVTFRTFFCLEP